MFLELRVSVASWPRAWEGSDRARGIRKSQAICNMMLLLLFHCDSCWLNSIYQKHTHSPKKIDRIGIMVFCRLECNKWPWILVHSCIIRRKSPTHHTKPWQKRTALATLIRTMCKSRRQPPGSLCLVSCKRCVPVRCVCVCWPIPSNIYKMNVYLMRAVYSYATLQPYKPNARPILHTYSWRRRRGAIAKPLNKHKLIV